jgi:predicted site-specific integrase-resolvase
MSATEQTAQRWIGTAEFCARYGVSRPTVSRWAARGWVRSARIPPSGRGRLVILDPGWLDPDWRPSTDPESFYLLRSIDVARLLGITSRGLRYWESAGKTKFRLIAGRRRYALSEVRRLLALRQKGCEKVTRSERQQSLMRWATWKLKSPPVAG